MTQKISEFVVRLANLAEAEGRSLRHQAGWFALRLLAWMAAGVLLVLGSLAMLCGMSWTLALAVGWPAALVLTGFASTLVGAAVLMVFRAVQPADTS